MGRVIAVLALCLMSATFVAHAQARFTEQDAIDLAVAFPSFHDGLDMYPGWKAAAYDSGNAYGIWRVQFWAADGEDLGWANVSPARKRVYNWESHFGATDAQKAAAEPILKGFVLGLPELSDLVDSPEQYPMYIDYSGWQKAWSVYLDRGDDSVVVMVQFDGKLPTTLDNPHLLDIEFPQVMGYDDWQKSKQALAIAAAFKDADIAKALSGVDGWTTSVDRQDDGLWSVTFLSDDQTLAEVTVDLDKNEVVEHHIGG